MLDIGWSELLLIAVVAIIVVGPRDLPRMMRTVGQYTAKMRSMARELRSQFDQALRDAELDDVRKTLTDLKTPDPVRQIRDTVTKPMDELKSAVSDAGRIDERAAKAEANGGGKEPAEKPDGAAAQGAAPEPEPDTATAPAPEAPPAEKPAPAPEPKRVASAQ